MPAITWISLGLTVAEAAARGVSIAIEGRDLVRKLVAENRDPTEAEWERLNAITAELSARIQNAD